MFAMIAHHEETIALTKSMQALFLKNVPDEVHINFLRFFSYSPHQRFLLVIEFGRYPSAHHPYSVKK